MKFCTVVNCIDGRIQLPVIKYLQQRFDAEYVDTITEAGSCLILSEQTDKATIQSILDRIRISIEHHSSVSLAVVGHHDCAGNPAPREIQVKQLGTAIQFLKSQFDGIKVIGLYVDEKWEVHEVAMSNWAR